MRGYITVPDKFSCLPCKHCGVRPVIAIADGGEYVVKCPNDPTHYQTQPGLIDLDDWNEHNAKSKYNQVDTVPNTLQDHFFSLNGAIVSLSNPE